MGLFDALVTADMKQKMLFLEKILPPLLASKTANEIEPVIRRPITLESFHLQTIPRKELYLWA